MPRYRTGIIAICPICSKEFHRPQHNIIHGTKKWCSFACKNISFRGAGNPFFGKTHSPEVRAIISAKVRANPSKGTGPKKGIFKHTDEAKKKMSEALRERWRTKRADMISYAKKGRNIPCKELNNEPRFKHCFTRTQKRNWLGTECYYCKNTKDLVIDHIIPIICSGTNLQANAQTLCQNCNRWKMRYVDRPLYFAVLGCSRG